MSDPAARIHLASVRAVRPHDVVARAQRVLDAGFEGLALEPPLYVPSWEALRRVVAPGSAASVRLFLPYPRGLRPGTPSPFRVASLHAEERRDAWMQGRRTLEAADAHAIPFVLVPAAPLDLEGPGGGEALRRERAARVMDSLMSLFSRLLEVAAEYGITLCVTPSRRRDEVPDLTGLERCLVEFAGAPLAVWIEARRWQVPDAAPEAPEPQPPEPFEEPRAAAGGGARDLPGVCAGVALGSPGGAATEGAMAVEGLEGLLRGAGVWLLDLPRSAGPGDFEEGRRSLEDLEARLEGGVTP